MTKIQDKKYYRSRISGRTAVHVVTKIADALLPYGVSGLMCWDDANTGVHALVSEIQRLKSDSQKLKELGKALKNIID